MFNKFNPIEESNALVLLLHFPEEVKVFMQKMGVTVGRVGESGCMTSAMKIAVSTTKSPIPIHGHCCA